MNSPAFTARRARLKSQQAAALGACAALLWSAALAQAQSAQGDSDLSSIHSVRDATGSPQWREAWEAIRADPEPFDATWRQSERPPLGLSTVEVRRNILVLVDDQNLLFEGGFAGLQGAPNLNRVAEQVYSALPDQFDFITIVLDWSVREVFAFYLPLSNNVSGIGYKNLTNDETDLFDETQGPLQGFIFMNDWRIYDQNPNLSKVVFLQEIGHRWGSFIAYDVGDGPTLELLGRDRAHWSYFMHSQNSALEGNDWNANPDGTFSTFTNASRMTFSDLDLYLMGVVPPEQVPPFFVIRDPDTGNLRDERGGRINRASPPELSGEIKTIRGRREDVNINSIIAAEGPRLPDHLTSQKVWRMATVFITRSESNLSAATLQRVETLIDEWEDLFEEGTREEMNLITNLSGEELPEDVPFGQPCQASAQCDPAEATVCLTVDDDTRLCSRRCFADGDCGDGFCCDDPQDTGDLFCYPQTDACPERDAPSNPQDEEDEPGDTPQRGDDDEEDSDQSASVTATRSQGCAVTDVGLPRGAAPGTPWLLGALALLWATRRRAEPFT